jgi:hypothetical protein
MPPKDSGGETPRLSRSPHAVGSLTATGHDCTFAEGACLEVQDWGPAAPHRRTDTGNTVWQYGLVPSILAVALWPVSSARDSKKAGT